MSGLNIIQSRKNISFKVLGIKKHLILIGLLLLQGVPTQAQVQRLSDLQFEVVKDNMEYEKITGDLPSAVPSSRQKFTYSTKSHTIMGGNTLVEISVLNADRNQIFFPLVTYTQKVLKVNQKLDLNVLMRALGLPKLIVQYRYFNDVQPSGIAAIYGFQQKEFIVEAEKLRKPQIRALTDHTVINALAVDMSLGYADWNVTPIKDLDFEIKVYKEAPTPSGRVALSGWLTFERSSLSTQPKFGTFYLDALAPFNAIGNPTKHYIRARAINSNPKFVYSPSDESDEFRIDNIAIPAKPDFSIQIDYEGTLGSFKVTSFKERLVLTRKSSSLAFAEMEIATRGVFPLKYVNLLASGNGAISTDKTEFFLDIASNNWYGKTIYIRKKGTISGGGTYPSGDIIFTIPNKARLYKDHILSNVSPTSHLNVNKTLVYKESASSSDNISNVTPTQTYNKGDVLYLDYAAKSYFFQQKASNKHRHFASNVVKVSAADFVTSNLITDLPGITDYDKVNIDFSTYAANLNNIYFSYVSKQDGSKLVFGSYQPISSKLDVNKKFWINRETVDVSDSLLLIFSIDPTKAKFNKALLGTTKVINLEKSKTFVPHKMNVLFGTDDNDDGVRTDEAIQYILLSDSDLKTFKGLEVDNQTSFAWTDLAANTKLNQSTIFTAKSDAKHMVYRRPFVAGTSFATFKNNIRTLTLPHKEGVPNAKINGLFNATSFPVLSNMLLEETDESDSKMTYSINTNSSVFNGYIGKLFTFSNNIKSLTYKMLGNNSFLWNSDEKTIDFTKIRTKNTECDVCTKYAYSIYGGTVDVISGIESQASMKSQYKRGAYSPMYLKHISPGAGSNYNGQAYYSLKTSSFEAFTNPSYINTQAYLAPSPLKISNPVLRVDYDHTSFNKSEGKTVKTIPVYTMPVYTDSIFRKSSFQHNMVVSTLPYHPSIIPIPANESSISTNSLRVSLTADSLDFSWILASNLMKEPQSKVYKSVRMYYTITSKDLATSSDFIRESEWKPVINAKIEAPSTDMKLFIIAADFVGQFKTNDDHKAITFPKRNNELVKDTLFFNYGAPLDYSFIYNSSRKAAPTIEVDFLTGFSKKVITQSDIEYFTSKDVNVYKNLSTGDFFKFEPNLTYYFRTKAGGGLRASKFLQIDLSDVVREPVALEWVISFEKDSIVSSNDKQEFCETNSNLFTPYNYHAAVKNKRIHAVRGRSVNIGRADSDIKPNTTVYYRVRGDKGKRRLPSAVVSISIPQRRYAITNSEIGDNFASMQISFPANKSFSYNFTDSAFADTYVDITTASIPSNVSVSDYLGDKVYIRRKHKLGSASDSLSSDVYIKNVFERGNLTAKATIDTLNLRVTNISNKMEYQWSKTAFPLTTAASYKPVPSTNYVSFAEVGQEKYGQYFIYRLAKDDANQKYPSDYKVLFIPKLTSPMKFTINYLGMATNEAMPANYEYTIDGSFTLTGTDEAIAFFSKAHNYFGKNIKYRKKSSRNEFGTSFDSIVVKNRPSAPDLKDSVLIAAIIQEIGSSLEYRLTSSYDYSKVSFAVPEYNTFVQGAEKKYYAHGLGKDTITIRSKGDAGRQIFPSYEQVVAFKPRLDTPTVNINYLTDKMALSYVGASYSESDVESYGVSVFTSGLNNELELYPSKKKSEVSDLLDINKNNIAGNTFAIYAVPTKAQSANFSASHLRTINMASRKSYSPSEINDIFEVNYITETIKMKTGAPNISLAELMFSDKPDFSNDLTNGATIIDIEYVPGKTYYFKRRGSNAGKRLTSFEYRMTPDDRGSITDKNYLNYVEEAVKLTTTSAFEYCIESTSVVCRTEVAGVTDKAGNKVYTYNRANFTSKDETAVSPLTVGNFNVYVRGKASDGVQYASAPIVYTIRPRNAAPTLKIADISIDYVKEELTIPSDLTTTQEYVFATDDKFTNLVGNNHKISPKQSIYIRKKGNQVAQRFNSNTQILELPDRPVAPTNISIDYTQGKYTFFGSTVFPSNYEYTYDNTKFNDNVVGGKPLRELIVKTAPEVGGGITDVNFRFKAVASTKFASKQLTIALPTTRENKPSGNIIFQNESFGGLTPNTKYQFAYEDSLFRASNTVDFTASISAREFGLQPSELKRKLYFRIISSRFKVLPSLHVKQDIPARPKFPANGAAFRTATSTNFAQLRVDFPADQLSSSDTYQYRYGNVSSLWNEFTKAKPYTADVSAKKLLQIRQKASTTAFSSSPFDAVNELPSKPVKPTGIEIDYINERTNDLRTLFGSDVQFIEYRIKNTSTWYGLADPTTKPYIELENSAEGRTLDRNYVLEIRFKSTGAKLSSEIFDLNVKRRTVLPNYTSNDINYETEFTNFAITSQMEYRVEPSSPILKDGNNSRLDLKSLVPIAPANNTLKIRHKAISKADALRTGKSPEFASKWVDISIKGRAAKSTVKVDYKQATSAAPIKFDPIVDTLFNTSSEEVLISNTLDFKTYSTIPANGRLFLGDIFRANAVIPMYVKSKSKPATKEFSSETEIFDLPKKNNTPNISVDYTNETLTFANQDKGVAQDVFMKLVYNIAPSDVKSYEIVLPFNRTNDPINILNTVACSPTTNTVGCILQRAYASSGKEFPSASIGVLNFKGAPLVATFNIAGKYDALNPANHSRPSGDLIRRLPLKKTAADILLDVNYNTEKTNYTLTSNHLISIQGRDYTGDVVSGVRFSFTSHIKRDANVPVQVKELPTSSSFASQTKNLTLNQRDTLELIQMTSKSFDLTSHVNKEYGYFVDSDKSRICFKKNTSATGTPRPLQFAPFSSPDFFIDAPVRKECSADYDYEISLEGLDSRFHIREKAFVDSKDATKNKFASYLSNVQVSRPAAPTYRILYDQTKITFTGTANKTVLYRYKDEISSGADFKTLTNAKDVDVELALAPHSVIERILQVKLAPTTGPSGESVIASDVIDIKINPLPNLRDYNIYIDHRDSTLRVPDKFKDDFLYIIDKDAEPSKNFVTGVLNLKNTTFYDKTEGNRYVSITLNGSNVEERFKSDKYTIQDNIRPKNDGNFKINYYNETSVGLVDTKVYELSFSNEFRDHDKYTLTADGDRVLFQPGRNMFYRRKSTVSKYPSPTKTLVVKPRPTLDGVNFVWNYVAERIDLDKSAKVLSLELATDAGFKLIFDSRDDALTPGTKLYFRSSAQDEEFRSATQNVDIPKRVAYTGIKPTINFREERLNETVLASQKLQFRTQFTTFTNVIRDTRYSVTPDVDVYLRNQAIAGVQFASEEHKVNVPGYPVIPADFTSVDYENESTLKAPTNNFVMTLDLNGKTPVLVLSDGKFKIIPGRLHYYKMLATDTSFATPNQILRIPSRPSNTTRFTINYETEATNESVGAHDIQYIVVKDRKELINIEDVPASNWTTKTSVGVLNFTEEMSGNFLIYRTRARNQTRTFASSISSLAIPARAENNVSFTLNYFTEQFDRPFSDRIEYAFIKKDVKDSDFSFSGTRSDRKFIGSEKMVSVSNYADMKLMYRIRATQSGFASKSRSIEIPPRAKPFDFSINYDTRSSDENFTTSIEYSRYLTMYNSQSGTGAKLSLDDFMGTYIYYRVKADPFDNKLGSKVKSKYIPGDIKIFLVDPDQVSVEREELAYIYLPQDPTNNGNFVFVSESQINAAVNQSNVPEGETYNPNDPYVTFRLINREQNLWSVKYNKPNLQVNLEIKAGLLDFTLGNGEIYKNFATNKLSVFYKPVSSDILSYPSPLGADDGDILTLEGREDIYEVIRVINIYGDVIFELNVADLPDNDPRSIIWRRTIDFSSQPKGTYYIQLIDKDGGKSPVKPILKI